MKQVVTQYALNEIPHQIKYNYTLLLPGSFLIANQKITAIEMQLD